MLKTEKYQIRPEFIEAAQVPSMPTYTELSEIHSWMEKRYNNELAPDKTVKLGAYIDFTKNTMEVIFPGREVIVLKPDHWIGFVDGSFIVINNEYFNKRYMKAD